jgi:hypothetical protein
MVPYSAKEGGEKMPKKYTLETLPEILTAQIISDYLAISRRRVYELFQIKPTAGGIPNFEIGLSKRVDKQDFISWIEARKQEKAQKLS